MVKATICKQVTLNTINLKPFIMKKLLLITAFISYSAVSAQCTLPIITDFECTAPSVGEYPEALTTVANPSKTGINTTDNVGQYIDDGTNAWDALVFDNGTTPIDLSTNNILQIKLYTPTSIQVLGKIEGGTTGREVWSPETPVNSWVQFEYDFSQYDNNNAAGGDMNTRIILFFNASKADGTPTDTYYIDDIKWTSTLSNEEFSVNDVTIHPNPAVNQININSQQVINGYDLIDLTGKVIKSSSVNQLKNFSIDVSALEEGAYFLNVKSNSSNETLKFIKI